VVQRRAQHQLARAQARQHLVEGYLLALQQLEPLVETIKAAKDGPSARKALVDGFGLSSEQAEAVLNLTLR
jgi:DNA gyrase subunit A